MKIHGRYISNWWLLCVPGFALIVPFGLVGLIMMGHIGGPIFGPVPIWRQAWSAPSREELMGTYVESERRPTQHNSNMRARLTLSADGSIAVKGLPDMAGAECNYSGTGSWKWTGGVVIMRVNSDGSSGSCPDSGIFSNLTITSYSDPRKLYWTIGDPDSGTGVWLKKEK